MIGDKKEEGQVILLHIEMEDIKQVRSNPKICACYVFIKPPSFEGSERHLRHFGTKREDHIQKRVTQARAELEYADTPGVYNLIIKNNDLETAFRELEEFVSVKKRLMYLWT
jgi:guanylate kinase